MRLAVVGLDSADWTLLDRWSHHLPHISSIRREGVSGRLASCKPPVTIPAWKCYSTGKNPGKLGIYWFAYPDFLDRRLKLNLPGGIGGNLWDYIPKLIGHQYTWNLSTSNDRRRPNCGLPMPQRGRLCHPTLGPSAAEGISRQLSSQSYRSGIS